jgi:hypothetical protein
MTPAEARSLAGFVNRRTEEGSGQYLAEPLIVGMSAWVLLVSRDTGDCPPPIVEVVDFIEAMDRAEQRGEAFAPGCRPMLIAWLREWLAGDSACAETGASGDVAAAIDGDRPSAPE